MSALIDLSKNPTFDIATYLDKKNEAILEQGLPISVLTDEVAFEFDAIDSEIEKLKEYEKAIKNKIKDLEANKVTTSQKCAKWFQDVGIEKLEGVAVSSITINKGTEETEVTKEKFVSILTKKQIEEMLIKEDLGRYEVTTETKPKIEATLRINKKRK